MVYCSEMPELQPESSLFLIMLWGFGVVVVYNFLKVKKILRVRQVHVRNYWFYFVFNLQFLILQPVLYFIHLLIHKINPESTPHAWSCDSGLDIQRALTCGNCQRGKT